MKQQELLQKIWAENELPVLARSRRHYDDISDSVKNGKKEEVFINLARIHQHPPLNWQNAVLHLWSQIQDSFPNELAVLEKKLTALQVAQNYEAEKAKIDLWLWQRVLKSGKQSLIGSRFFADNFLFHRTLREDRLVLWYGARYVEWPLQLLLGLFLGTGDRTKRLRLKLYWPTAKLPDNFEASRFENRVLRRLWEARILIRFGTWVHLHPQIMLYLPEISSYSSPVLKWKDNALNAHMSDGRVWPVQPFALAALVFDESLALANRNRMGLWKNFLAYAEEYLKHPEDTASRFVLSFFEDIGLAAMSNAQQEFLSEFTQGIQYLENLRAAV